DRGTHDARSAIWPDAKSGPLSGGQPLRTMTWPSCRTRRPGRPSSTSFGTARRPQTTAAVLAALASTQLSPEADTSDQYDEAQLPVVGSTMWWRRRAPRRHVRTAVLEDAIPPASIATTWSQAST